MFYEIPDFRKDENVRFIQGKGLVQVQEPVSFVKYNFLSVFSVMLKIRDLMMAGNDHLTFRGFYYDYQKQFPSEVKNELVSHYKYDNIVVYKGKFLSKSV